MRALVLQAPGASPWSALTDREEQFNQVVLVNDLG
jgi:hypothetical protein